jgi:hypothetical protein
MSSKFEQLLDYLVNEEHDKANELFHEIVVEKSREIYENLIAEEEETDMEEAAEEEADDSVEEETEEEADDSVEESTEETVESMFGDEEEEEFPVQDKTDDAEDDVTDHDFGGMDDDEGDSSAPADKGDIQDLEDALEELKAEFEALMAAEKNEEENEPGVHDDEEGHSPLDSMKDDNEDEDEEYSMEASEDEESAKMESRTPRTQGEKMREYIEKVSVSMVDGEGVGSGRGDKAGQTGHDSGKSPVSSGSGKPTSGANAKNVAQAGKGADEDGTKPHGKVGGLVKQGGQFVQAGTKNVGATAMTKKPDGAKLSGVSKPGNAEGKPVGAGTGQNNVTGATNTKSIESGK